MALYHVVETCDCPLTSKMVTKRCAPAMAKQQCISCIAGELAIPSYVHCRCRCTQRALYR